MKFVADYRVLLAQILFFVYNKNYLWIIDYHSKFPVIKMIKGLSEDNWILSCKVFVFLQKYGLSKTIIWDAGGNFISEKFKEFYKILNIEQAAASSYHHQSKGQVEAYTMTLSKKLHYFNGIYCSGWKRGWGTWTHCTIIEKGDQNNDQLYKVHMTKIGELKTRNTKHLKATPITWEQHLRNQISKNMKTDTLADKIRQFWKQI